MSSFFNLLCPCGLPAHNRGGPSQGNTAADLEKHRDHRLVENAHRVVSLLPLAQQEELRAAFDKFDNDGSGTM